MLCPSLVFLFLFLPSCLSAGSQTYSLLLSEYPFSDLPCPLPSIFLLQMNKAIFLSFLFLSSYGRDFEFVSFDTVSPEVSQELPLADYYVISARSSVCLFVLNWAFGFRKQATDFKFSSQSTIAQLISSLHQIGKSPSRALIWSFSMSWKHWESELPPLLCLPTSMSPSLRSHQSGAYIHCVSLDQNSVPAFIFGTVQTGTCYTD